VTVNNSILTNNSSYGLYRGSGAVNITNGYDDIWQNASGDYFNVTAGTGSFSANPLYVTPGSVYRLTSNSPARNSDSTGGDLGAFPYVSDATVGLVGTLWTNVTLSTGTMTGDVVIPAGVTVTVPAGVVLTAASSDALIAGNDTSRVELIVRGTLNVTGVTGMQTTFGATGASAGSWTGVRVESGGTLNASGLIVEKASYGLDSSGTLVVTGSTLRTNTYGARVGAGTTSLGTSLFTGNTYGAYGLGGVITVDHSTLVSNTYAVFSASASGSVTVNNSVLTNNSSYGLYRGSGAVNITNGYNDAWQNASGDYFNVTAGTGSISSNPLFVTAGNYRLTSNSPARKSDSLAADMGAFPYTSDPTPGLYGTLWVNTTVSASATLGGDLTVPAGVTLTLGPGVTLTAPASDIMISGNDTARTELIVRGTLTVNGTGASPVLLTSTGTSAGSWTGVRLEAGSTATFTGAVIEEASYGIDNTGSLVVNGSTLRTNTYGVRASAGTATIATSLFAGNTYGTYGLGGLLGVDHSTLASNTYGIFSASASGSVTVNNSVITNNSSYGLYRGSGAVNITNGYNDAWQNASGDYFNVTAGTGSISANPLFVTAGSNYRLTSNSPARKSDSLGGDMGAFPYTGDATAGLVGTLWVDTTLSTGATLLGDLTVGPGVTLTLSPGVTLTAGASDLMIAGNDTSRVEVIVRGTLNVSATPANPVVLTSSTGTAGSWTGLRVEAGGAASLAGITVRGASYGIDANANVSLSDSSLTSNTYGARVSAGSTSVARTFFTSNTYGAYGLGGVLGIDHSTLVSNTYGVFSASASGSVAVNNSVLTNNSSYGLYRGSGAVNITNGYNDAWQNASADYFNVTAGTGSISSNPLYVLAGSNYRLTSNSPARKSDSLAGDMGAFPYIADQTVGLVGTLWASTTLSTSAPLLGDLTVAPGVTVTVAAGVTLTAPASDLMISGNDTSRTELIVLGTLQLSGTPASPVVLTATGASAGSWTGVRVMPGGSANITSTTILRGTYCLDLNANATVTSSRFSTCTYGVRSNAGTSTLAFSVFDTDTYGVYGLGGAVTVDHATMYGNTYGVFSASASGSLGVTNSILTNHSSYGLYRGSGAVAITNSYNLLFSATTFNTTLGSNTLSVDPLLVAPASADFHLQSTSPARMAGTSASDLGAFPFAPGTVDHLVISPVSATLTAGATFTFSATAFDVANNPVPTATITWTALPAAGVINASGVLTASCTPGSVTGGVTATSAGRSASANVSITTAPIASLVVSPANVNVRSQQNQQFTVTALDVCNNPVASPAVTWVATGSAGIIDTTGQYTAGCTRGAFPNSIVATAGSVTGRASVMVDPGVLSAVSLSPSAATLAVNSSRQFTGSAADGCGNPLTSTLTYATTVPGGNVSTSGLFTAGATPGTFNNGLTASASEGAINRSASANLTITGGAIATVTVMPSTATLATGGTTNFMAIALDSLGNMVAGTPTWTVVAGGGSITSGGTFTAGAVAGTFTNTVQASISGVSGFATVIVQPGAVTRVLVAPMSVTLAPTGTTTFTAQALDANNNTVTAAVTWSASASSGTITQGGVFTAGTMSGNYPAAITATVNGISGTANVSINAGALAQLTITPSVATTQAGGTVGFAATGRDGNNNTIAVTPTWSVVSGGGTISPSGVFSAGTMTGTFSNTVRAESNGVTAFATVTVSPGPLARLELTPSFATLDPGAMQQFTGAGKDAFGNAVAANITWSSNANAGSITAGGLFTAGTLPGDFMDGVTATAGNVTATASIRVGMPMAVDAGSDAGMMVDGGADAGMTVSDAGVNEPDAGPMLMPDGGSGTISGKSGCGCGSVDAMAPLLGLALLALRRRRSGR
jgi:uncharacterized protein (TIGR03382 family)